MIEFQRFTDLLAAGKVAGKRVFIRSDFNVPLDEHGNIADDTRIRASLPCIQAALKAGAAIMVASHLGRPIEGAVLNRKDSLAPIAKHLEALLNCPVLLINHWVNHPDLVQRLLPQPGQIILLENCRANVGEKDNDANLAQHIANFCDIYVNDAFGSAHRAEVTTSALALKAPIACAGPLLAAELDALSNAFLSPQRPLCAIVAGSKVSTKLTILQSLSDKVDQLIVGGGIANTFIQAAGYNVGKSLTESALIPEAQAILKKMSERGAAVWLPIDVVVAERFAADANATIKAIEEVSDNDMIFDIGPKSIQNLMEQLLNAKTIVWNGPIGVFEFDAFGNGTRCLAEAIASSHAYSIAGGGDTLAAIAKYNVTDKISYISTGGGAFLEFLEGKTLPAVAALNTRSNR